MMLIKRNAEETVLRILQKCQIHYFMTLFEVEIETKNNEIQNYFE